MLRLSVYGPSLGSVYFFQRCNFVDPRCWGSGRYVGWFAFRWGLAGVLALGLTRIEGGPLPPPAYYSGTWTIWKTTSDWTGIARYRKLACISLSRALRFNCSVLRTAWSYLSTGRGFRACEFQATVVLYFCTRPQALDLKSLNPKPLNPNPKLNPKP